MATAQQIQSIIDSKVTLITQIVTQISTAMANPQPSYTIGTQSVDWASYVKNLTDIQAAETKCLQDLYKLQNVIDPYQFQSCGGW